MYYLTLPRSRLLPLLTLGLSLGTAWEFPSQPAFHGAGAQRPLHSVSYEDVDIITGSQFSGLKTYANLAYLNCLSDEETKDQPYDIAIIGAPFDTAVTGRPGSRYGPTGIRTGSQRMGPDMAWSVYTGKNPLKSWAVIKDCGDVPLTWLDNTYALKQLDKAHRVVSSRKAANRTAEHSATPRILTLGGDHTTTLSALRSVKDKWGQVAVVHFDSHIDTWDPKVLGKSDGKAFSFKLLVRSQLTLSGGGGISDYAGLNHGTFLHIAHEEGLISNNSLHAGIRAPLARRKGDMRNDVRCGFHTITARDLDRLGAGGVISQIRERVGDAKVYLSVDIDVLDPAFAPATGTAEPGGWTSRELLTILDGLSGINIIGGDVVEVAPIYDNPGETTILAAAEVAFSLLQLMVDQPVKSLADMK